MLQRRHHIIRRLNNIFDVFLTAVVFVFAHLLREYLAQVNFSVDLGPILPFKQYASLMVIACFLWPVTLNYYGLYDPTPLRKAFVNVGIIFRSTFVSTAFLIAIIFLFQIETISRLFLIGFGCLNAVVFVIKDLVRRQYGLYRRHKGKDIRPVLVVGSASGASQILRKISEESYLGLKPEGVVLLTAMKDAPSEIKGVPVVGTLENWREVLHAHPVASVIFTDYHAGSSELSSAMAVCEEEGVEFWLLADFLRWNLPQMEVDYFAHTPVFVFKTSPVLSWPYVLKLFLDRLFAFVGLIVLSPLFILIALSIWIVLGRPVLYKQKRVGRFGQSFYLFKFRSLRSVGEPPTQLGYWIRRSGLDELPQLFNILRGEMSFVGPRPHIPEEVNQYKEAWQRRRFTMKPGLTCYRQVLRPGKVSFDEVMALDLKYIDQWSLWVDLFLIFKTCVLFLRRFFDRF